MAEFAYNNAIHSSTKHSPFYASRGYHPHTIMSQIASSNVPSADALVDKIQKLHQEIQAALQLSQQDTKRYYDNRHRPDPTIPIGTRVWVDATNIQTTAPSKKLTDKRLGPFKVLQQITPLNYKLELPQAMKIHPVFHTNLLTARTTTG